MWNDLVVAVGPPFIGLVSLVVTAAIGMGVNYIRQNWMNEVAQSAFANVAGGIVNKLGEELLKVIMTPDHPDIVAGVAKVQTRIPNIVKGFGLTPTSIAERLIENVGKLQAPAIGAMIPAMIQAASHAAGQVEKKT